MMARFALMCGLLLALSLVLTGCRRAAPSPSPEPPSPTVERQEPPGERVTLTPSPTPPEELMVSPLSVSPLSADNGNGVALPQGAAPVVQRVIAHHAERVETTPDAIQVVAVEAVDWPDASLGCPQPDRMYAQMVTPGFRVVLQSSGQVYEYHTDQGDTVVICE